MIILSLQEIRGILTGNSDEYKTGEEYRNAIKKAKNSIFYTRNAGKDSKKALVMFSDDAVEITALLDWLRKNKHPQDWIDRVEHYYKSTGWIIEAKYNINCYGQPLHIPDNYEELREAFIELAESSRLQIEALSKEINELRPDAEKDRERRKNIGEGVRKS